FIGVLGLFHVLKQFSRKTKGAEMYDPNLLKLYVKMQRHDHKIQELGNITVTTKNYINKNN
nr:hypothetical protein [Vibrio vulnificus]